MREYEDMHLTSAVTKIVLRHSYYIIIIVIIHFA
jgi:hypothetical protein